MDITCKSIGTQTKRPRESGCEGWIIREAYVHQRVRVGILTLRRAVSVTFGAMFRLVSSSS
jgi:hypothetical protein